MHVLPVMQLQGGAGKGSGSAYKAIMEFVIAHPEMCNGFAIIEYDLAPYQPAEQQVVENVETIQYSHSKDRVAGNCGIVGAINGDAMQDEDQGHKNKTFITTIQNLPEGRYRYINGRFVYTGSVQTQH